MVYYKTHYRNHLVQIEEKNTNGYTSPKRLTVNYCVPNNEGKFVCDYGSNGVEDVLTDYILYLREKIIQAHNQTEI